MKFEIQYVRTVMPSLLVDILRVFNFQTVHKYYYHSLCCFIYQCLMALGLMVSLLQPIRAK